MRVSTKTYIKALQAYLDMTPRAVTPLRQPEHFKSFFGITKKQWVRYIQTKKLKVSPVTAMKRGWRIVNNDWVCRHCLAKQIEPSVEESK